ncbi:MAG TPA: tRNA lysidine(34) synthetase TilS [Candidatus Moranbacteria bacterium]|nr:tRNA lysidine(34) synthetase TilS [Candidatus Moranbacteria bacterium]
MKSLIKKIQTFSKRFSLLEKGAKIIIGVSGGPDSVCLLGILNDLKVKYNFDLLVVHINYGLREKDSDKDEEFVRNLADKLNLELVILKVDNFRMSDSNLEKKLRNIRYDFFEKVRKNKKFDLIAVAHNRNDQAETILMRLLRGAGLQGLKSMSPKNRKIIRPLLKTSRKEILNYLEENNLKYRIDKSNKDTKFFRNKIRQQLIPYLEKEYNPAIKKTLAKSTENISDDYDFISLEAMKRQNKLSLTKEKNKIEFDIFEFRKEHSAMQRQILRQLILEIRGDLDNIQNAHIEEVLKIIISKKNKRQIKEFADLKIERKGGRIQVSA